MITHRPDLLVFRLFFNQTTCTIMAPVLYYYMETILTFLCKPQISSQCNSYEATPYDHKLPTGCGGWFNCYQGCWLGPCRHLISKQL